MNFPSEVVALYAESLFGVNGLIQSLGSCQDANFRLISSTESSQYVVKISNRSTLLDDITFQNHVMQYLTVSCREYIFPVPQRVLTTNDLVGEISSREQKYFIRLLTYVEGRLLSDFNILNSKSLESFGKFIATLNSSLSFFKGEFLERDSQWDMKKAYNWIIKYLDFLIEYPMKDCLLRISDYMNSLVLKKSDVFYSQVIHGDLADYNVVAKIDDAHRDFIVKITGVIDFGDVVHSWIVGDIAIAIVPLLIRDDRHCLLYCADVLRGFLSPDNTGYKMNTEEITALWPLVVLRSILLVVSILYQIQIDPCNEYCKNEIILNTRILTKVLRVPSYAAQVQHFIFSFLILFSVYFIPFPKI